MFFKLILNDFHDSVSTQVLTGTWHGYPAFWEPYPDPGQIVATVDSDP
jgi:hypothetical protein